MITSSREPSRGHRPATDLRRRSAIVLVLIGLGSSVVSAAALVAAQAQRSGVAIPLEGGWRPEGPGAVGGGYKDGVLDLRVDLLRPNAYAELFVDLRALRLPGVAQHQDGSYDLASREIVAIVRSEPGFKGDPMFPNGAQIILKNARWDSLVGPWSNITDGMASRKGADVFYRTPDGGIARSVAGLSLKFTIGSRSTATFRGRFIVESVTLVK